MAKHNNSKQKGFTIVELMIASAVFTVVLIGALAGFLQIGKQFYKGTSLVNTQEVAKQVLNDVAESIQRSSEVSSFQASGGFDYICIGNIRYTYELNSYVDRERTDVFTSGSGYGLVRDILPGTNACAAPCPLSPAPCAAGHHRWNSPTEMLGDNMKLAAFDVQANPSIPDYYTVNLVIAYGDDDLLELATPGDPASVRCSGTSSQNQHFCAVARYSTSVKRGSNF